jgi:tetraacyldisaccharide 4'-kinase
MPAREKIDQRSWLEDLWFGRLPLFERSLALPLRPLSFAYRIGLKFRNAWWRMAARSPGVRTISVGNLTVGGNGKTPFTLFLAARLQARGLTVGIVSRGFGRRSIKGEPAAVVSDGREIKLSAQDAGDEPLMMAKLFRGPIVVARRRVDGIKLLRQIANPDVVLLDDGFQHRALKRDVDLVMIGRERGFGNGRLLPSGPMREPLKAIRRADAAIVISGGDQQRPSAISKRQMKKISRIPVLHATLRPHALVKIEKGAWVEVPVGLAGRRVLAVSGLANPAGFYAMLHEIDADLVGVLEYPDHHDYSGADWQTIVSAGRDADMILTTEKDLVKLEKFPFVRDSLYALRLEVVMSAEDAARLDTIVMGEAPQAAVAAQAG